MAIVCADFQGVADFILDKKKMSAIWVSLYI